MLNSAKSIVAGLILALVVLPVSAHAGSSWSTVTVDQSQSAGAANRVNEGQFVNISTQTSFQGQTASSNTSASQAQTFVGGNGNQTQRATSGSALEWTNSNPSHVTASSVGAVDQWQHTSSNVGVHQTETASVAGQATVDGNHSAYNGTANHINSGDADQHQQIAGEAQSEGWVRWPSWNNWCGCGGSNGWSSMAGQLVQDVTVTVRNIINF